MPDDRTFVFKIYLLLTEADDFRRRTSSMLRKRNLFEENI